MGDSFEIQSLETSFTHTKTREQNEQQLNHQNKVLQNNIKRRPQTAKNSTYSSQEGFPKNIIQNNSGILQTTDYNNTKQNNVATIARAQIPNKFQIKLNKNFQIFNDYEQKNAQDKIVISQTPSAKTQKVFSRKQIFRNKEQNHNKELLEQTKEEISNRNIFQDRQDESLKKMRIEFLQNREQKQQNQVKIQQATHYQNKFFQQNNFRKKSITQKYFSEEQKESQDNQNECLSREENYQTINKQELYEEQTLERDIDQLPKKIQPKEVKKLRVELERYQRLAQSVKEISIVTFLRKSIECLERAQQSEQEYIHIIQNQSSSVVKQQFQNLQKTNRDLAQQLDDSEKKIEDLYSEVSGLNQYQEMYEEEKQTNKNLQDDNQLKGEIIKNQMKQIQEKEDLIKKKKLELKKKEEIIQNQQERIEQTEDKLKEQITQLEQQKEKQDSYINQLNSEKSELTKYKQLFENSQQSLLQLQKQQGEELEKYKKLNQELQKSLENEKKKFTESEFQNVQKIVKEITGPQIQANDTDKKVKDILQQINPSTTVQDNLVQFAKALQVVQQNQPNDQQKKDFQTKNDQIVQQYLQGVQKIQSSNVSTDNDSSSKSGSLTCLLVLQNMFKQDGINTYITDQSIQSLEQDQNYKIQQSYLQVGLHNQAQYFSIKIDNQSALYQNLMQSKSKQNINEFLKKLKQDIGLKVNSQDPQQDIQFINIDFDKLLQIDFQVKSHQFSSQEIKKKMTFSDLGLSVSEKNLLEFAKLSVSMFDSQFNQEWPESQKGKYDIRGQLKFFDKINPVDHVYHFPAGYKGYALNINIYGDDKSWISSKADEKTWIVLFHGTNEKAISGIMKENLAPGHRNLHGGGQCRITNTTIKKGPNANVYLTDDMSIAEHFAGISSAYEGKQYYIIFQCRVNPNCVKSPVKEPRYYTVEDNQNIRPYRILLKEAKQAVPNNSN